MHYYLRFECYDGPDRHSSSPVRPDVAIDKSVHFEYGRAIYVGKDENDHNTWPLYYVANLELMEQIDDPAQPGKNAVLLHVYLARAAQWSAFDMPQTLKELLKEDENETDLEY